MEQFQHLLRKRNRALGLFARVVRQLAKLEAKLQKYIDASYNEMCDAREVARTKESEMGYLRGELAKTQAARAKVEAFIP